jgi:hypothetical protein
MADKIKVLQIKTEKNVVFECLLDGIKMQLACGNYELGKDFPEDKGLAMAENFPQTCMVLEGDVIIDKTVKEEPKKDIKETVEEVKVILEEKSEVVYNSSESKEETKPVKKAGRPAKKK